MNNLSIQRTTLLKLYATLFILFLITTPIVYGLTSIQITLFTLLLISSFIIFSITTTPLIKFISLAIFLVKSFLLFYLYQYTNIYIFPDSYNYIEILNRIIQMNTYDFNLIVNAAQTTHVGFYYIYLFIYQLFGTDFAILVFNTLFITLSAIMFYKIFEVRFSHKIAFITFVLFSLSANMFLFGSFILKDPIGVFLTASALYLYLNKKRLFLSLLVSFFLVTVRIYSGFGLIIGIIVDYLIFSNLSRRRKMIAAFSLAILSLIILNLPISQTYLGQGTRFLSDTTLIGSIIAIPTTLVKFFFAPLPWNVLDTSNIYRFLFFDSVIAIMLSFGLLLFVLKWLKFKELRTKYYIFFIPILIHAFALGVEYGGDSTRQRSGIFVFLILTIVSGLFYKRKASD